MNEISFFVFRHGETDWNVQRRFQGHTDIPLNETGRAQALALHERLRSLSLEALWSSDLSRAHETARLAARGLSLEIETYRDLREILLGEAEGQELTKILEIYGQDAWDRWRSTDPAHLEFSYPGGETKRRHLERLHDCLTGEQARRPHLRRIGVATHGGCLIRLIHASENAPTDRLMVANGSLYHLDYVPADGRWFFRGEISRE